MHKIKIGQHAIDRAMARRGRLKVYEAIDPAKTALIVVDMQNAFVAPGFAAEIGHARDIVPNINKLAASLRAAGGKVVWIRNTISPETAENWSVWADNFMTRDVKERMFAQMARGHEGHELWPLLEPAEDDAQIEKRRFSALVQGASDLEPWLRERGLDTLLITGTATHVCCESTARDAMMLNFKTLFISDANAAPTDEDHNATLTALFQSFCDVQSTDEAIACFGGTAAALAAE
jgi:ureidoacrylate peracid hydrolase